LQQIYTCLQSDQLMSPLKILVSAYACEPGAGSEPGAGWNLVREISRTEECWIITRANHRRIIETFLALSPMPRAHFVYFDLPRWARFWKKGQRGIHAYYYLWQLGAYRLAKKLFHEVGFDVVHHMTLGTFWLPSFLALLPAPFLWGPVGGGETAPPSFRRSFSPRGRSYEILRDAARFLGEHDPFVRMTARHSALALATTQQTAQRLRAIGCREVAIEPQAALRPEELEQLRRLPDRPEAPFRFVSLGRFLHWKGFEFSLRAFAKFHRGYLASEYWLIGGGPERQRLQELAQTLGVGDKVFFTGSIPRTAVLEKISECDVFLHPSFHDSGPLATVEAMAAGLPVVCLDLGGPGLQVTSAIGIKIVALTPEQVIADFATAMEQLATNSARRTRMSAACRVRMEQHFNWQKKGRYIVKLYESLAHRVPLDLLDHSELAIDFESNQHQLVSNQK
jgi:glycosyltransferase involved in cell wall biosynthesis